MKFFHVFRTVNLVNLKSFVGVHGTDDIFFGTDDYFDDFIGTAEDLLTDLELLGRERFHVKSFHAFQTEAEAQQYKNRIITADYLKSNTYNKPLHIPDHRLGHERIRQLISSGNFSKTIAPETRNKFRSIAIQSNYVQRLGNSLGTIWINNGNINLKLNKETSIPPGFVRGLKYKERRKGRFTRSPEFKKQVAEKVKAYQQSIKISRSIR